MKYLRVVKKTARSCRIVYQIMSAVRLLHHDLVEKPKEDHTFKPRQPNPNQWKIFQGPGRDCHGRRKMTHDSHDSEEESDRLEEDYVSNMADARLAVRALQNLRHSWNEGWI